MQNRTLSEWQQFYNEFVERNSSNENDLDAQFFAGHWLNLSGSTPSELDIFLAAVNRLPKLGGDVHSRSTTLYEAEVTSNLSRPWFRTGEQNDSINGTDANDRILSREGDDRISTGAGDDVVWAYTGNDVVYGGDGNDQLFLHQGNDYAQGGRGNDLIHGAAGNDRVRGGEGDDTIFGGSGFYDKLYGDNGDDTIYGDAGEDWLWGSNDDDTLFGGADNDSLWGGNDADVLFGGDGDDWESGGAGDDSIFGGAGDDEMHGNRGNDFLACRDGADWMDGGGGNDTLLTISDAGQPIFSVNESDSVFQTANADDRLTGGSGADEFIISYQLGANQEILEQYVDETGQVDWETMVSENDSGVWLNWGGVETIDDYNQSQGDQISIRGHSISLSEISHMDTNDDGVVDSTRVVLQSEFMAADQQANDLVGVLQFNDVLITSEQLQFDNDYVEGEFLTI